jgi:hypothetical protein
LASYLMCLISRTVNPTVGQWPVHLLTAHTQSSYQATVALPV